MKRTKDREWGSLEALTSALQREFDGPEAPRGTLNSDFEDWRDNRAVPIMRRLKRAGWVLVRKPRKAKA